MIVAEFSDGIVWPLYDSELSEQENVALAADVAREARRRVKAGLSDLGRARLRRESDRLANDPQLAQQASRQ